MRENQTKQTSISTSTTTTTAAATVTAMAPPAQAQKRRQGMETGNMTKGARDVYATRSFLGGMFLFPFFLTFLTFNIAD
jgi:hypothetical protein